MINNINFKGNVFYAGATKLISKGRPEEYKFMKRYADNNSCDVIILDRDYYRDNTGIYSTIVAKEEGNTGINKLYAKTFDFGRPERNKEREFTFDELV